MRLDGRGDYLRSGEQTAAQVGRQRRRGRLAAGSAISVAPRDVSFARSRGELGRARHAGGAGEGLEVGHATQVVTAAADCSAIGSFGTYSVDAGGTFSGSKVRGAIFPAPGRRRSEDQ